MFIRNFVSPILAAEFLPFVPHTLVPEFSPLNKTCIFDPELSDIENLRKKSRMQKIGY